MLWSLLFSGPLLSPYLGQLSASPVLQVSHYVFGRTNMLTAEIKTESEIAVVMLIQREWRMLYTCKGMGKKMRL